MVSVRSCGFKLKATPKLSVSHLCRVVYTTSSCHPACRHRTSLASSCQRCIFDRLTDFSFYLCCRGIVRTCLCRSRIVCLMAVAATLIFAMCIWLMLHQLTWNQDRSDGEWDANTLKVKQSQCHVGETVYSDGNTLRSAGAAEW